MNLRVGININWFARLRGTAFQNIVPIFVSRFPSFGRGFDPHRPYQNPNVLKAFSGQLPAYRVPQTLLHNESSLKRIGLAIRIGQADRCASRRYVRHRAGQRFTVNNATSGSLAPKWPSNLQRTHYPAVESLLLPTPSQATWFPLPAVRHSTRSNQLHFVARPKSLNPMGRRPAAAAHR